MCAVCEENQTCTDGTCECNTGYEDCDRLAATGCEARLATDETNCGGCGVVCPMMRSCISGACATCSGTADCNDMLACTTDTCSGGACSNMLMASRCLIAGVCRNAGEANPANPCEECDPVRSTTAWSTNTDPCSDGMFCTAGDACSGGTCRSGAAMLCADALSCTTDSCDEIADTCVHPVSAGCLIGGACVLAGAINPANACQECRPSASTTSWSARTGVACEDGQYCTTPDACSAGGSPTSTPVSSTAGSVARATVPAELLPP